MTANAERIGDLTKHCPLVVDALLKGRVVPFLGAGVNLCDRPSDLVWEVTNAMCPPSGSELAKYLAQWSHYPVSQASLAACPDPTSHFDLARISQYGATLLEEGPLYEQLHTVFGAPSDEEKRAGRQEFQPTAVHTFLAGLRPRRLSRLRSVTRFLLPPITTT